MGPKRKFQADYNDSDEEDNYDPREFADDDEMSKLTVASLKAIRGGNPVINNVTGIMQKVEDILLPRDWPWIETATVYTAKPVEIEDVEDDLKREAAFYQSAVVAVKQGLLQLEQSGVPYKRPMDFYAESVKPDSHMAKVKQVILNEKKKIEEIEERKKQRELKKFAKSVHSEKKKERATQKREAVDEIERFKNKNKHNEASSSHYKSMAKKAAKEAKYGRAKKSKKNDRDSLNDFSSFNNRKKW